VNDTRVNVCNLNILDALVLTLLCTRMLWLKFAVKTD